MKRAALRQLAKNLLVCCDLTVKEVLKYLKKDEAAAVLEEMSILQKTPPKKL
jgi:hypothetical protein